MNAVSLTINCIIKVRHEKAEHAIDVFMVATQ